MSESVAPYLTVVAPTRVPGVYHDSRAPLGEHDCRERILADCVGCHQQYALCLSSAVPEAEWQATVDAVLGRRWRCYPCGVLHA